MSYFAELDKNKKVLRVIVADQEFIDSGAVGDPANWTETFMDKTTKGKYAGIGDSFDKVKNKFIEQRPFPSWVLDENTDKYKAPREKPTTPILDNEYYYWSEEDEDWIKTKLK